MTSSLGRTVVCILMRGQQVARLPWRDVWLGAGTESVQGLRNLSKVPRQLKQDKLHWGWSLDRKPSIYLLFVGSIYICIYMYDMVIFICLYFTDRNVLCPNRVSVGHWTDSVPMLDQRQGGVEIMDPPHQLISGEVTGEPSQSAVAKLSRLDRMNGQVKKEA